MTLSLLQPAAALVGVAPAAAAPVAGCYLADPDSLVVHDTAGGTTYALGDLGVPLTALALDPVTGTLVGAAGAQLGTVATDGTFAPTSAVAGGDLTGLAFDAAGLLHAVRRVDGAADEYLVVDPATGTVVGVPVPVATARTDASDLTDVAVTAAGDVLVVESDPTGDVVGEVDTGTGSMTVLGTVQVGGAPLTGVVGLAADPDGELWASTTAGQLVRAVPGGVSTVVATPGGSLEGLACGTAASSTIAGVVFVDDDRDGVRDDGETAGTGVPVHLQRDGTTVQSTTSDATDGTYTFSTGVTGPFTVVIEPPGGAGTTAAPPAVEVAGPGSTVTDVDVGYRLASVGGVVFDDLDGDGLLGTGEAPVAGVTVTVDVLDGDGGTSTGTATTDADGTYVVDGLPGGEATVSVPAPDPGGPLDGSPTPPAQTFPLAAATHRGGTDVAYDGRGTVTGTVRNDLDGDPTTTAGEPGLGGVDVRVAGGGPSTTTAPDGSYSLRLPPGDVTVEVDPASLPTGAAVTLGSVDVTVGRAASVAATELHVTSLAVIGGRVFNDLDALGTDDAGADPGFAGVPVTLDWASGTASTTTDATGAFAFTGLSPETYTVTVDTAADDELPDTLASTTGGNSAEVTITAEGQLEESLRLGYDGATSVTGTVWDDLSGEGTRDAGEPPMEGVIVAVDGVPAAATGPEGTYTVGGLGHGAHTLTLDPDTVPAGATVTTGSSVTTTAGDSATLDVGIDASVELTGAVFSDRNGSGARDPDEPGTGGVTVEVSDGSATTTATTGDDGTWSVTGLPRGTYAVTVTAPPADAVLTTANDTQSGIDATAVGTVPTAPVGYHHAVVAGRVFGDLDGDGDEASPETGIPDVPVTLHDAATGDEVAATTTDADGAFRFDEVAADVLEVRVAPATGPAPDPAPVTVTAGEDVTLSIAVDLRGSIGDLVFNDLDGSQDHTAGEPGVAGVRLEAVPQDGGTTGVVATTDDDGAYLLEGLAPGTYTVVVDPLSLPTGAGTESTPAAVRTVTVGEAEAVDTVDIGYDLGGSIVGTVWNDVDADEVVRSADPDQPDEPAYAGVDVALLDAGGATVASTTTDADGDFSFEGVPSGDYRVLVDVDDLPAAGLAATTGNPVEVVLDVRGAERADVGFDAGASVPVEVWNDLDGDGLREDGEPPLADVPVVLTSGTYRWERTTGAAGTVTFGDLVPGTYDVTLGDLGALGSPARTANADPVSVSVADAADAVTTVFGVEAPVSLAGRVANDLAGDGSIAGDPGLAGVEVQLRDGAGVAVGAPVVVDATTGGWALGPLAPGTWTVEVVPTSVPSDADQTSPLAPADGSDGSFTVTLAPNTSATGLDVGYDAGATITGRLWDDLDHDQLVDGGEGGLGGVTVTAEDATGPVDSATTTDDGSFTLEHLPPGTYTVVVDEADLLAAGYERSTAQPVTITVAVTQDATLDPVGYWRPASIALLLFEDLDGDGVHDTDEPVGADVEGRTVELFADTDGDGAPDGAPIATGATDAAGRVVFPDLVPGDHVVDPATPDRYVVTTGNDPADVDLAPGQDAAVLVGIQAYAPVVTVAPPAVSELHGEAGDVLRFPFEVANDGNVADAYDVGVASAPAASAVVVRADDPTETSITTTGSLAPGDRLGLIAIVTVPGGLARGDVVSTTLTLTGTTPSYAGPVAAGSTTVTSVVAMPVLGVTIEGGAPAAGYATPGTTAGFSVVVGNGTDADRGPTVATARAVELELGIGPDDAAAVVAGSIAVNGQPVGATATFPLVLDTLDAGGTATVTFDVAYERPLADGTVVTLTTTATATGNPQGDPRTATASTSDTVSSSPLPDATLVPDPPTGSLVEPGAELTYAVTVADLEDATDTWREVRLVADLPATAEVTAVTVAGVAGDPGLLGTGLPIGDLDPGDAVTVVVTARVDDPVADASVVTALFEVAGANGGPVVWAASHTVESRVGVAIGPDRHGTGAAATAVAHPHQLENTGNVTTVFDLAATTDLGWPTTVVVDANQNLVADADEPPIDETPPLTAADPPLRLLSVVEVPPGETDGTSATTTLAAFSQALDPDALEQPAIAQAFAVTEAVAPDLAVDIVASPSSTVVERGQTVTYTTTVRNDGRAPATGVVLTDPTPEDASFVSGSASIDGAPVPDGPGATNPFATGVALGEIGPGQAVAVSFRVTVGPVSDGTPLIDEASVVADDGRASSDSVTQTVSASPVLDVVLSSTPAAGTTVTAGTAITYTAIVTNLGTLDATGVTLRQPVPDRTSYVAGSTTLDGTAVADVGGTGPAVAGLSLGALAPDASRTVRFQVRVADPVFDGEVVTATATVSSDQGVTAASRTLRSTVDVRPAISLAGGGAQDVARPGQAVYPQTLRNAGDVTDTFTLQARSDRGWPVSLVRDDDGDGAWDPTREVTPVTATGPLAPGAGLRFFAVVEVASDAALGSADTTTVSARSVVDPDVTAATTARTRATAPSLELTMSATPSGDRVNPGSPITYVVSVRNRGAAPATEVVVTSATPSGTEYEPNSASRDGVRVPDGTAADGNPLAPANGGVRIPSIAPGGEVLATFTVDVPPTATVGQVVTATAEATATATSTANASKSHTVAPGPALDLVLTADPPPGTATPAGTRIAYTLQVRNIGQQPATGVRVLADTPRDTTYVLGSARRDGRLVADGATDPNPLSSVHDGLAIGDLAAGGDATTLTYAVLVDDPVPTDARVEHRALAEAGDTAATSDRLVHTVAVTPAVAVTADVEAQAVPAGFADLAHTVTNTGDVTDVFALSATSGEGWVTAVHTDRDGDGDIETGDVEVASTPVLAPGEATTVVVRVAVPATAPVGTTDVVRLTATSGLDPDVTGSARDTIAVVTGALRLTKTATPLSLTPGARSTYTLSVRNVGTSPATDVTVTDAPPAGTTYVAGSTRRDGATIADVDDRTPLEDGLGVGVLAPGAATTLTFVVETLPDPGRTSIVNSATASSGDTATSRAGTVQPVSRDHGLDLSTAPDVTVAPGTTVVRPHVLTNTGAVADEVALDATSRLGAPVTLHLDLDGDGAVGEEPPVGAALTVAPGEQVRILAVAHYTAEVPEGARDEILLVARSGGDSRMQVSVTDVVIVSRADVSVTMTADPAGDVAPGDHVTYSVVVTNHAATSAPPVTVVADTPTGTLYVPGSAGLDGEPVPDAPATGTDPNPFASSNGGLELVGLAAGGTATLRFAVTVAALEPGVGVAAVAGLEIEGRDAATSNTVVVPVVDGAGLQVLKTASPTAVAGAGEVVTWTISVMNLGTGEAHDVVVSDPPAAGTRYLAGSTTLDGRPAGDGLVSADGLRLGDLPAGATRVVTFRTVLDVPGAVVQNVATVRSAGSSARPLSNVAAVTVGRVLPATGADGARTLGGAAALLVSGWMLLYVARPERRPVPVLQHLTGRTPTARRRRTTT